MSSMQSQAEVEWEVVGSSVSRLEVSDRHAKVHELQGWSAAEVCHFHARHRTWMQLWEGQVDAERQWEPMDDAVSGSR